MICLKKAFSTDWGRLIKTLERNMILLKNPEYSKRRSQLLAEKILKSISSAVYLSQHLLFSELTQPIKRTQKVNKDLTPSDITSKILMSKIT